jgi:hypothetical protein
MFYPIHTIVRHGDCSCGPNFMGPANLVHSWRKCNLSASANMHFAASARVVAHSKSPLSICSIAACICRIEANCRFVSIRRVPMGYFPTEAARIRAVHPQASGSETPKCGRKTWPLRPWPLHGLGIPGKAAGRMLDGQPLIGCECLDRPSPVKSADA